MWAFLKYHKIKHFYNHHQQWSKSNHQIHLEKEPDLFTFTVLRCPIIQTKSFYAYLTDIRKRPQYKGRRMKKFSDWIRDPVTDMFGRKWEVRLSHPNFYVNFFGKEESWDDVEDVFHHTEDINDPRWYRDGYFDLAVEALKSMDRVFDMNDNFNQKFSQLMHQFGYPEFSTHVNKSESNFLISKDDLTFLKKHREKDIEICKMFNVGIVE